MLILAVRNTPSQGDGDPTNIWIGAGFFVFVLIVDALVFAERRKK